MSGRAVESLNRFLRRAPADAAPPDAVLLRQFAEANDPHAFEALLARHGPMVLGTARRLVANAADADDVFQAVFLSLARRAGSIRRGQSVPNWLYTTTRRVAARARRRRAVPIDQAPEPCDPTAAESDLAWREVKAALDEELHRLPQRLRSPLLLCYLAGLTRDEAAEQLGWSLGTLKRRLEEGRAALRRRLERRGVSAAGLALAVLAPAALDATVPPSLAKACLNAATGAAAPAGLSALVLPPAPGIAMKAVVVSVSLVAVGLGAYAGLGRAGAPPAAPARPPDEPPAAARAPAAFGDPLPAGVTMRLGTDRFRQGVGIVDMAVSADGQTAFIVTGTRSPGGTRAFDLATGLPRFTLKNNEAQAVALSPDGQSLVTKGEFTLHVRDPKTGAERRTIALPKNQWGEVLAFTPDGKHVAAVAPGPVIQLIDFADGKVVREFTPTNPESSLPASFLTVLGLAFSPDGKWMATGGFDNDHDNYFARLWDVETGKEVRRFMHGRSYGIPCLAFSPDSKMLATVPHDGRLRLFDVATGKLRRAFPNDGSRRDHGAAFTPDGRTVAAAGLAVHLFDVATGEERVRIDRAATHLNFRDDGRTLVGVVGGAVYRWDAATGKSLTPDAAGDSMVEEVRVTADGGRIVTRAAEGDTHFWDGTTGKHLRVVRTGRAATALSPDGRHLAWAEWSANEDRVFVRLFDLAAGRLVERFPELKAGVNVLAFTADGRTLLTIDHRDGTVRLWDVASGTQRRTFQPIPEALRKRPNPFRTVVASPDGRTLAVVCNERPDGAVDLGSLVQPPDTIRLWDVATGKERRAIEGYSSTLTFSPDGRWLVTAGKVWEVATGRSAADLTETLPVVAFSPDGRCLATVGYDRTVRVLEVATWAERTRFRCAHEQTTALAFTPAGHVLCGGIDTTVLAYDVRPRADDAGAVEAAWTDLGAADAARAYRAQGRLVAAPGRTIQLFAEHVRPVPAADADRLRRLIAELGDAKFAVREAATKALVELGESARAALEEAARSSTSPEVAGRATAILDKLQAGTLERLRERRAVEVLERIASAEAKDLLKRWAGGVRAAVLTEESRAALGRLDPAAAKK